MKRLKLERISGQECGIRAPQRGFEYLPLIDGTGPTEKVLVRKPPKNTRADRYRSPMALAVACLMVTGSLVILGAPETANHVIQSPPAAKTSLSPHDPIHIDNDVEFQVLALSEGWQGDGSEGDPYLIEEYEIDASGHKQAIMVGNSTVHFVISNCVLFGATESGIQLLNSANAMLVNNTCVDNAWNGIAIVNSHLVNATNNTCGGSHYGILVQSSYAGSLYRNNCTDNGDGIIVKYSTDMDVVENVCWNSTGDGISDFGDGIRLLGSDENLLSNNSCTTNTRYQIRLEQSDQNTLASDTVTDLKSPAYESGLDLYQSNSNIVMGTRHSPYTPIRLVESCYNEIIGCEGGVIRLQTQSNWNTLSGNHCPRGIFLSISHNNTLSDNNCSYARTGIYVDNSHDNDLFNNTCTWNTGAYITMSDRPPGIGIDCVGSRNTFIGNNCSNARFGTGYFGGGWGAYGMRISGDGSIVEDNVVCWSEQYGIIMFGADIVVRSNTVERNGFRGLSVSAEGGATVVANNTVRFNKDVGISISGDDASVVGNFVESNEGYGIRSTASMIGHTYQENCLVNDGIFPDSAFEWVDTSNTVNGLPMYHIRSQVGGTVPAGAGQIILYDCMGVLVEGQDIRLADVGIKLEQSSSCIVRSNICNIQMIGIWLHSSSSNTILSNNISGNLQNGLKLEQSNENIIVENGVFDNLGYGVSVSGSYNRIWNNTFARNNGAGSTYDPLHVQAYTRGTGNYWNASDVGNYWSDWTAPDVDYDGIVDVPYLVDASSGTPVDYFPRTTPTVVVPVVPIPEFASAALALMLMVILIGLADFRRVQRRRE